MLRLIPGTLAILATWLVLLLAFAGIGAALRRGFGVTRLTIGALLECFWVGFAVVILFLITWNFLLPVNGAAALIVLAAGGAGLWLCRRDLAAALSDRAMRPPWWAVTAAALIGLWAANLSTADMTAWDTALYHWQGVRWAASYPAIPGLANLFGPLGFNNSAFLYDAMLDTGPWRGGAYHLANGLFVFAFGCQAAWAAARLVSGGESDRAAFVVPLLCLTGSVQSVWVALPSFITDVAAANVVLALMSSWYGALVRRGRDAREDGWGLVSVVTLAALAVSLKLNMAIFSALVVATAGGLYLAGAPAGQRRRALAWAAALGLAFGIAWPARGVVLSGYALFPSRAIALPVEWRAPAEHAQAEFAYVVDSGRQTVSNLAVVRGEAGMANWLPAWARGLEDQSFYIPVPLLLLAVGLVTAAAMRRRATDEQRAAARAGWWPALPPLAAIAAWFSVAPEPRYASPLFWSLATLSFAQAARLASDASRGPLLRRLVVGGLVLAAASQVAQPLLHWHALGRQGSPLRAVVNANLRIPPPGHWLSPRAGGARTTPFQTQSGFTVNVPERLCWDAPLCTPNPAPNLRLRRPGRLESGFVVDGPWQMLHWPEPWRPDYLPALRAKLRREGGD